MKSFLDRRGKRFWWLIRSVLVAIIGLAIYELGRIGGKDYVTNIYTELIGVVVSIGITVVIVDRYYERRDLEREKESRQRAEEQQNNDLKRRLVWEVGSGSNEFAKNAIGQMRYEGWLTGKNGLLKGEFLSNANLQNANLRNANLRRADLQDALLYKADLSYSKLRKANLRGAKLQGAYLFSVSLHGADFSHANLQGAKLTGANLRRAKLMFADFQGAFLVNANLHGVECWETTLPDGTPYTRPNDLDRFTNRHHPDFRTTFEKIIEIRGALGFND